MNLSKKINGSDMQDKPSDRKTSPNNSLIAPHIFNINCDWRGVRHVS